MFRWRRHNNLVDSAIYPTCNDSILFAIELDELAKLDGLKLDLLVLEFLHQEFCLLHFSIICLQLILSVDFFHNLNVYFLAAFVVGFEILLLDFLIHGTLKLFLWLGHGLCIGLVDHEGELGNLLVPLHAIFDVYDIMNKVLLVKLF